MRDALAAGIIISKILLVDGCPITRRVLIELSCDGQFIFLLWDYGAEHRHITGASGQKRCCLLHGFADLASYLTTFLSQTWFF